MFRNARTTEESNVMAQYAVMATTKKEQNKWENREHNKRLSKWILERDKRDFPVKTKIVSYRYEYNMATYILFIDFKIPLNSYRTNVKDIGRILRKTNKSKKDNFGSNGKPISSRSQRNLQPS